MAFKLGVVLAAGLLASCDGGGAPPPTSPPVDAPAARAEPAAPPASPATSVPSDAAIAAALEPWTGDLDGMVRRRFIRVLVTFSKTNFFLNRAEQRGATYDAGKLFESFLNKRLALKQVQVQLMFLPVSRDRLFQALAEGRGDIAAASLAVTPGRETVADFATPFLEGARDLVVTAANEPPVAVPADLAGREVHVRKSSAYYEHLQDLNASLRAAGKRPVTIVEAPERIRRRKTSSKW